MKYQYTYFIHSYVIKENKYSKYITKMLKDKNCNLRIFQKEKDLELYTYFSPKIRETLFGTFDFNRNKVSKLEGLPLETRVAILSKMPCIVFEYNLNRDIQGKTEDKKGIFFKIQKIELICFNTGICFLCIKTNIEDSKDFGDILNFNYKFRDVNQDFNNLKNYDKIKVQTDNFDDIKYFKDFIQELTGSNLETLKLNIESERFLTYSYACIEQDYWNENRSFRLVEPEYIKYTNVLPNDSTVNYNDDITSVAKWKYAKMGISKNAVTLFSSSVDMNNYTVLPIEFENQYFYTYILELYKKIYLKKLDYEFKIGINLKSIRRKFIDFTRNVWIQEVTTDDIGTLVNHKIDDVLELDKTYFEVKNKYDVFYKELNIEKNAKSNTIIVLILIILLIINLINFGMLK